MKNFSTIINNKEFWISRSVAVCGFIFTLNNGLKVLANKRGNGCPNEVGKWCCPGGYIDYDETIEQACIREIKEESNLDVKIESLNLYNIDSNPNSSASQNITLVYWTYSPSYFYQTINGQFAEPDEVDDVKWIDVQELDNYDWAFNHKSIIMKIVLEHLCVYLPKTTVDRFKEQLINFL